MFLGCSPLTSDHWTHTRPIIRFTIWYILTSVFRMFTSHLRSLNTYKTNNTFYNMIYTYFCLPLTSNHWTPLTSNQWTPLTSNHSTHKRPIIHFTIWYILTSVFRMFTSHLKSLNTYKTNNTFYNMIYTYFCF